MKPKKKYEITWYDATAFHGWHAPQAIKYLAKDYLNLTTGYYVLKTRYFSAVAQSSNKGNDEYGNIIFIPTKTILKTKELK